MFLQRWKANAVFFHLVPAEKISELFRAEDLVKIRRMLYVQISNRHPKQTSYLSLFAQGLVYILGSYLYDQLRPRVGNPTYADRAAVVERVDRDMVVICLCR